ncbi:recombination activating protein 1 [Chryseobacterium sp. StRB126]|nr:recombination activating protein 1 [Chryseobacterium sp. StRB126]
MGRQNPPSKANRFRILAGRIIFFNDERNKKRTDQKQLFEKYLNPELIGVDVETYSLDLSSDTSL